MSPRPTTALGLLCDLINRDNPGLKFPITEQSVGFRTKATAIAIGTYGRNAKITMVGKPGFGFKGDLTVMYDRLSLNSLYYGNIPTIQVPPGPQKYEDLVPYIADQLGLFLSVDDFDASWRAATVTVNATRKSVSVRVATANCYIGTFTVYVTPKPIAMYPNSGPGPKGLLFGDTEAGYFGDLPVGTLIGSSDLIKSIWNGATGAPSVGTEGIVWGKFFWKGKVIYISWSGVSVTNWKTLYLAGVAIGDSTFGPTLAGITPTLQNFILTKRLGGVPYSFRVRTPRLSPDNVGSPTAEVIKTSELYLLTRRATESSWYGTGEWADSGHSTNLAISLHVNGETNPYNVICGLNAYSTGITPIDGSVYWHPVLEYIDPSKEVMPLLEVSGGLISGKPILPVAIWSTYIQGLIVSDSPEVDFGPLPIPATGITPTTIGGLTWSDVAPQQYEPKAVVASGSSASYIQGLAWSSVAPHVVIPKSIAVKGIGIFDPSTRIDLSTTNGELDGF